ncbi:MAG: HAMP domain-containing protein [Anaerolineaceae bacterium]|nr:HAMP domain-containing protein [Anaerolineaceae bacterium]
MAMPRWLSRSLSVFRRLQWKLTLTYTLVTVGVLTILLMLLMFVSFQLLFSTAQMSTTVTRALTAAAAELAPAMRESPPDLEALRAWSNRVLANRAISLVVSEDNSVTESFSSPASDKSALIIFDQNGSILTTNQDNNALAGQPASDSIAPGAAEMVRKTLLTHQVGDSFLTLDTTLYQRDDDRALAAAPIFDRDGSILGGVLLIWARPNLMQMLGYSVMSVLPTTGFLTLMSGVIGIIFGVLTARGLVSRLNKATRATAAWGLGDFSVRIDDKNQDEIGLLAADLNHMAGELQALMQTRQELAAVDERNRLARDLHDSVKQQVFATSMNLAAAQSLWEKNPAEARSRLEAALALSRQSQQELTGLIQTLRPVQLEKQKLSQALNDLVRNWSRQNQITASCEAQSDLPLAEEVEQALFRVTQEALSNISRHSRANAASLDLVAENGRARLTIIDNGQGFDPLHPQRGLGLQSMQERLHAVGGSLHIESGSAGTRLEAVAPCLPAEEAK